MCNIRKTAVAVMVAAGGLVSGQSLAVENAGGGGPVAAPTHTVPAQPNNIVIKQKSSTVKSSLKNDKTIEERQVAPTDGQENSDQGRLPKSAASGVINHGGQPGNTWDANGQCYLGTPPKNYRCPNGGRIVDVDPTPKVCWRCEIPQN